MRDRRRRGQVLIVEDQPDLRQLYREALSCLSVEVIEAADGAAAAEMLDRERPDVVVTDLEMPRKNGFELCRLIRHGPAACRAEVIAVTGLAGRRAEADILACGARVCLA
jgi:CheY-like chemotaxis protein